MLRVEGPPDRRIAVICDLQRGRVSRRQLIVAGITDAMIETRMARGSLRRVRDGIFATGPPAELTAETEALLAAGPHSVLSHSSAVRLWELLSRPPEPTPIHITVSEVGFPRRQGITVHRSTTLLRRDTRLRDGLPVTSPARTLLDYAATGAPPRSLELAFDTALRRRIATPRQIRDVVHRARGRPGAPALAALLARGHAATFTRREAEERLLALCRSADLPFPRFNVPLRGYEIDALWPDQRVAVEVDSVEFHSTRSAFEHDRAKGAALAAAGLSVIRVTWHQLRHDPLPFLARLAAALAWGEARAPG